MKYKFNFQILFFTNDGFPLNLDDTKYKSFFHKIFYEIIQTKFSGDLQFILLCFSYQSVKLEKKLSVLFLSIATNCHCCPRLAAKNNGLFGSMKRHSCRAVVRITSLKIYLVTVQFRPFPKLDQITRSSYIMTKTRPCVVVFNPSQS